MKFIHLGDLHLGIKFHKRSLIEDQKHALTQVVELAKKERANVFIAGDVYDTANPSIEAQALWFDFIKQLSLIHMEQGTQTIVIPGNHDSAARLSLGAAFTTNCNVHIVTDSDLFQIFNVDGVSVLAVSFLKPQVIDALCGTEFKDDYTAAFNYVLDQAMTEDKLRDTVVIAHQTFEGGVRGESEFKPFMSDAISASVGDKCACIIAGHLHAKQSVGNIYYSGSLLPYAFGDDYKQELTIRTYKENSLSETIVPLDILHRLKTIEGDLAHVLSVDAPDEYVKVKLVNCVHMDEAMARLQDHFPYLMTVTTDMVDTWEANLDKPIGTFTDFNEAISEFCKFIEIPVFRNKHREIIEEAAYAFNNTED